MRERQRIALCPKDAENAFQKTKPPAVRPAVEAFQNETGGSAEGCNPLSKARKFPRCSILGEHALGNAPLKLRLRCSKRGNGRGLVVGGERSLDLLHEGTDATHAGAVDFGPPIVAPDALLCLRRIRHVLNLNCDNESGANETARAVKTRSLTV
jgi:hypothetical protein